MKEFQETQKFGYLFIPVLIMSIIPLCMIWHDFYLQIVKDIPVGNQPMSDQGLIFGAVIMLIVTIGVNWLLFSARLDTRVDKNNLQYRYFPFIRSWRTLDRHDINFYEVKRYAAIREYGGWGYKPTLKNGLALNVYGNQGLYLELSTGKKLMIGTQNPIELAQAMESMMNKTSYGA